MRPDAAGRATLAPGTRRSRETLTRPASVPGSAPSAPDDRDRDGVGRRTTAPKKITLAFGGQVDAGHAARGRALRAHRGGGEAQQLGVARHEHELRVVGRRCGAHDRVAGLERR